MELPPNPARFITRNPERKFERFLSTDELAQLGEALAQAETEGLPYSVDETKPTAKHAPKPQNRQRQLDPFAIAAMRLATAATIIASQSIITGAFFDDAAGDSAWLAAASDKGYGQIYVGLVNWLAAKMSLAGRAATGLGCAGGDAGAELAPFSADMTGSVATSTNPYWLQKVNDPPRDCCWEKLPIW